MVFLLLCSPAYARAPTTPLVAPLTSKEDMVRYATQQALAARILPSTVLRVISCESNWVPTAVGDHGHSHGLVQIYDTAHPEVSREMADDPYFAIDFLVRNLHEGNGRIWTCYRRL